MKSRWRARFDFFGETLFVMNDERNFRIPEESFEELEGEVTKNFRRSITDVSFFGLRRLVAMRIKKTYLLLCSQSSKGIGSLCL